MIDIPFKRPRFQLKRTTSVLIINLFFFSYFGFVFREFISFFQFLNQIYNSPPKEGVGETYKKNIA